MTARAWRGDWEKLAGEAARALRRARGRPRRGAAIADEAGDVHAGASISPAGAPAASICAEHAALVSLIMKGSRRPRRIVSLTSGEASASPPCGRCLQVLIEFAPDAEVRWGSPTRECGRSRIDRLLPEAFRDFR